MLTHCTPAGDASARSHHNRYLGEVASLWITMGQSYEGRLWDAFRISVLAGRKSTNNRLTFDVLLAKRNGYGRLVHQKIHLWAVIGPGDDASPVITIGFPEDF